MPLARNSPTFYTIKYSSHIFSHDIPHSTRHLSSTTTLVSQTGLRLERLDKMAVVMAVRCPANAKLSLPSSSQRPSSKPHLRLNSLLFPTSTTFSFLALFNAPNQAKALTLDKDQIVSSLNEVEKTIDQVLEAGSSIIDTAQKVLDVVGGALKPAIDTALPVAKQAGEQALKLASPAISEATKKAQEAIQTSGIDTQPVLTAAKTVADAAQETTKVAKPIAASTIEIISSSDPVVIVGTAGALFVTYLLFPPIWSAISFSFRGYKGDLTPAQSLDLITRKNHFMIDIRSEKDKEKLGIPRLPSSAKNIMIPIPLEELPSKLRGLVRNVKRVEAEIAALKISFLKRINEGSNIIILDSYSDSAKLVARVLTSLGFKNCWVVSGGFSGSRGWLQSRLGADTYKFSFAEVISPSQIIPAATKRIGTTASKFLPGGSD